MKPVLAANFEKSPISDMVRELNTRTLSDMKVEDFIPDIDELTINPEMVEEFKGLSQGEMKSFLIGVNAGMYLAAEYVRRIQKGEKI